MRSKNATSVLCSPSIAFLILAGYANERLGLDSESEIYRSMAFVFILNVFNVFTSLPFSIYGTFVVEQK